MPKNVLVVCHSLLKAEPVRCIFIARPSTLLINLTLLSYEAQLVDLPCEIHQTKKDRMQGLGLQKPFIEYTLELTCYIDQVWERCDSVLSNTRDGLKTGVLVLEAFQQCLKTLVQGDLPKSCLSSLDEETILVGLNL